MKIQLISALFATVLTNAAMASAPLTASSSSDKAELAISLVGGTIETDDADATTKGFEVSFNSALAGISRGNLRHHVSFVASDDEQLDTLSLEFNPHYLVINTGRFDVGMGPSFGITQINAGNLNDKVLTYGLGVSSRLYLSDNVFIGADARWAQAQDVELEGVSDDVSHSRILFKAGFQLD